MSVRTIVRSEARCALGLLLLVATVGCSFDTAPLALASSASVQRPVSGSDGASQAGQPAASESSAIDSGANSSGAIGGGTGDSGTPPATTTPPTSDPDPIDAGVPPPSDPPDATRASGDAALPDAGDGADTGTTPDAAAPPTKGLLFGRCVTDDGCSLGLVCYGSGPGHCAQPCAENSDCVDVDGFDFTCSSNDGACRIDCSDDETACPQGTICVARSSEEKRCMLPREEGTFDRELFEPCDRAHGDDDCVDGLVCYRSDDSHIDGPGYCTAECGNDNSACDDVSFWSADLECAGDVCRFDCTKDPCPFGMACEMLGNRGVCHYPQLPAQP